MDWKKKCPLYQLGLLLVLAFVAKIEQFRANVDWHKHSTQELGITDHEIENSGELREEVSDHVHFM